MYPIHWGTLDPDIYEKSKNISIDEAIKEVVKAEVENEDPFECPCNKCKQPKEKTWEEAASDLALRVIKLEKEIEELKMINNNKK